MAGEVSKPHDHLFRSVFREEAEAAGLLRAHLPEAVNNELLWSSLKGQEVSFIDDRLRDSESDLLYAVQRKPITSRCGCTCCWSASRRRAPGCGCGC